jgi:hypothetical protein
MTTHWVYILENCGHRLTVCLSADIDESLSGIADEEKVVYLRDFSRPFDALAHKHLLDALSSSSIRHLILKYKNVTRSLLDAVKTVS